jgi:hypothetical protein
LSAAKLLSNNAAQDGFERLLLIPNEQAEGVIDPSLIAPSPSRVSLTTEPLENVVIEADRDASLAGAGRNDGAPSGFREIVVLAHG